ncbi:hypothetical protein RYH70_05960 [Alloalcanivorax xenomutans]|uniref:hypothetical protein n=1 Tax=Alloalcanivorax xenomutans TaxID=1094342 RepID=UPI002935243F|nr:hypothetical protein [Alloalcanivorax xenomutans]WOD29608.1 hypothetical protein RYH70_05960 [Alloalcanivorax xenomutans]
MTKPYDVERTEVGDMACLAVEQFNYLEALFSALAGRLDTLERGDRTIRDARRLALLGRSHAEQWACAFLDEING